MSDWILIDHSELNRREETDIDGVTIDLFMSPYQIPTALRIDQDDKDSVIVVFKYIDDEPWIKKVRDDGIVARIGKNSKRLFGLEISRDKLGLHGPNVTLRIISPEVSKVVDNLKATVSNRGIRKNYEAATKAISQLDDKLLVGAA